MNLCMPYLFFLYEHFVSHFLIPSCVSLPSRLIKDSRNSLSNASFSASIMFIIITQRGGNSGDISKEFMVWLEVAKSGFASAVWLWLLFVSFTSLLLRVCMSIGKEEERGEERGGEEFV